MLTGLLLVFLGSQGTTAIIELLRKYNDEKQLDTKVKSDNVFSLAMSRSKGAGSKKTDGPTKISLDIDITVSCFRFSRKT